MIRNVDLSRPTPLWMVERLRRSDIRSIDPVVDVTNYVMIELGQPMHAFDLAEINGGVRVRMAEDGEKLVLLDGQEITLRADTLVIADHQRALAIAGVMGGEHSGVSDSTRDLFLEAAFFDTIALAGKARSYGLHTDSSHRFERGVDSQLARKAMERATRLILDIVGGEPGPIVEQVSEAHLPKVAPITLRAERVTQMLGMPLDAAEIVRLLQALELTVVADGEGQWSVGVPSHRFDISLEVDLIESWPVSTATTACRCATRRRAWRRTTSRKRAPRCRCCVACWSPAATRKRSPSASSIRPCSNCSIRAPSR